MKLNRNSYSTLIWLSFLGMIIGSLGWEVLERILSRLGMEMSIAVGPIGVDLAVLAVSLWVNPGTFLGIVGSILLFRAL